MSTTSPISQKAADLIQAVSDANFDCSNWIGEAQPYEMVHQDAFEAEEALRKYIAELESKVKL